MDCSGYSKTVPKWKKLIFCLIVSPSLSGIPFSFQVHLVQCLGYADMLTSQRQHCALCPIPKPEYSLFCGLCVSGWFHGLGDAQGEGEVPLGCGFRHREGGIPTSHHSWWELAQNRGFTVRIVHEHTCFLFLRNICISFKHASKTNTDVGYNMKNRLVLHFCLVLSGYTHKLTLSCIFIIFIGLAPVQGGIMKEIQCRVNILIHRYLLTPTMHQHSKMHTHRAYIGATGAYIGAENVCFKKLNLGQNWI